MINQDKIDDFKAMMEKPNNSTMYVFDVHKTPEYLALVEDSNDGGCHCKTVRPGGVIKAHRRGVDWYCADCGEEIVKDKPTSDNLSRDESHAQAHIVAIDPTIGSPVSQEVEQCQPTPDFDTYTRHKEVEFCRCDGAQVNNNLKLNGRCHTCNGLSKIHARRMANKEDTQEEPEKQTLAEFIFDEKYLKAKHLDNHAIIELISEWAEERGL